MSKSPQKKSKQAEKKNELDDIYNKATGSFNFIWDVAFVGHKSCDLDPILGAIPLIVDLKLSDWGVDYAYPLRHFTDADVWEYTERYDVAYNDKRYNKENGYKEFDDITYNNDYYHCCTRCLNRDNPASVDCPKLGYQVANISGQVRLAPEDRPKYLGEKAHG